jgi:hypothetical protein
MFPPALWASVAFHPEALNREWHPGRSAGIGFTSIGTALRRGRGKAARFTLEWEEATASAQPGDKLNDSASGLGAVFDVPD